VRNFIARPPRRLYHETPELVSFHAGLDGEEKAMRRSWGTIAFVLVAGLASPIYAQSKINIVYPIAGEHYPITDPGPGGLRSAYFTASFSVTCAGGLHKVEWSFDDSSPVGHATFYDQTSVQFVHKLPGGRHIFRVRSDCGEQKVEFIIGR
jgi:hypothetical protein